MDHGRSIMTTHHRLLWLRLWLWLRLRLNHEIAHAHSRQLRAQPAQMKKRTRMIEKRLSARINGTPLPINPKQKQRVLLFPSFSQGRARPDCKRPPRRTAPNARRTQSTIPRAKHRIARDKSAHGVQHARPALPARHGPQTPKEVSAYCGRCVDAWDEEHEAARCRIAEGDEPQMR